MVIEFCSDGKTAENQQFARRVHNRYGSVNRENFPMEVRAEPTS